MILENFEYNGKKYGVHSGAAWRVAKVQKILGMDFFQDIQTLAGEPWKLLLPADNPKTIKELLSVILDGEVDEELIEMGTTDLVRILTPFFSDVVMSRSKWNGELKPLPNATEQMDTQSRQETTPSTSQSTASGEETPSSSSGSGKP